MVNNIQDFMNFWKANSSLGGAEIDPCLRIYRHYLRAVEELEQAQRETFKYARPINPSGKAWVAGYDPNHYAEVATMATEINLLAEKVNVISDDIDSLVSILDGGFELGSTARIHSLAGKVHALESSNLRAGMRARSTQNITKRRNPGISLSDLAAMPAIQGAEADLVKTRENNTALLADLKAKIAAANEILDRYHGDVSLHTITTPSASYTALELRTLAAAKKYLSEHSTEITPETLCQKSRDFGQPSMTKDRAGRWLEGLAR